MKKCDAFCDTSGRNLWLRNGKFYYILELPRVDGKRRYLRQSLHTDNYYEALERTKLLNMTNEKTNLFKSFLRMIENNITTVVGETNSFVISLMPELKKIAAGNTENIGEVVGKLKKIPPKKMTDFERQVLAKLEEIEARLNVSLSAQAKKIPHRKIAEMLDAMILKSRNCDEEKERKRKYLTQLLGEIGLTLDSDYAKFHTIEMTDTITENIKSKDVKGDVKVKYVQYIKELMSTASKRYSDDYKRDIIENLPVFKKTQKDERDSHTAYTDAQLLEIFDPKHKFFEKNDDIFFACLIAMFTGARRNSAITLQYDDIKNIDGIDCIHFRKNHELKRLKNQASIREVPINPQLLEIGFVDYVRRRQTKLKVAGTDFIFPRCITSGEKFSNKFFWKFFNFLEKIGVRGITDNRLDFHSFRKNANLAMEKANIPGTFINELIGWEGKDTREQSYSAHSLSERKEQMDKFGYDFLSGHFAKWKVIMAKKP